MILTIWQLCFCIRIGFALLLLELICPGAEARVSWQANPEPDIAAYVLSWSKTGAGESDAIRVEGTEATVAGLEDGAEYVFRVFAFNTAGMSSDPSDPVTYTVSGVIADPQVPKRLTLTLQVTNDMVRWVDLSTVVIDNPPPKILARVRTHVGE